MERKKHLRIAEPNEKSVNCYIEHSFRANQNIKSCPFCDANIEDGLVLLETGDHETWFVMCQDCMCEGPSSITKKYATEAWNDRTERKREVSQ